MTDYIKHYGTPRHSGRYPWGSGEDPYQSENSFLRNYRELSKKGLSPGEIAKGLGMTTSQVASRRALEVAREKQAKINFARALKDKNMSNVAIGERMGINESSVRALLAPGERDKTEVLTSVSEMLRDNVARKKYVDIGLGVENHLGISPEKLRAAAYALESEGYHVHNIHLDRMDSDKKTHTRILTAPETTWAETMKNRDQIQQIFEYSEDGGRTFLGVYKPKDIDLSRVKVRYASEGGDTEDGIIHVRPGVEDVSLGGSTYAQVRISVDGTHYLKGVAVYKADMPKGVDLVFNTNKDDTGNPKDAMKPQTGDPDNPFGATIRRQQVVRDGDKIEVTSVMNIVNEEGSWDEWNNSLASQMLSKQPTRLIREQLDLRYETARAELEEAESLTNPVIKRQVLMDIASSADSASVHLAAAAMPRQSTHVIIPVNSMKPTEIFAPNYKDGEKVVLIRYPHGGIFEIPELTVNNRNAEARERIGSAAIDAVGIHHTVAERLSGADFDGDSVLVIPNTLGKIRTAPALAGLAGFDPIREFPLPEGEKFRGETNKLMGDVSNLITDMTIKGATPSELSRAVRHSMVVIDAEKHNLDHRASADKFAISALKKKYQDGGGASTIISLSTSDEYVDERGQRIIIDPKTGKQSYVNTGRSYIKTKKMPDGTYAPVMKKDENGVLQPVVVNRKTKSTKGAEAESPYDLVSSTSSTVEMIYAEHAQRMRDLANEARRIAVNTPNIPYSPSARETYADEVAKLDADLNVAMQTRPLERQAQVLAGVTVRAKLDAAPDRSAIDLDRLKYQALTEARARLGSKKKEIPISDRQWDAIQAGAVTTTKLERIVQNTDRDELKKKALPRTRPAMTGSRISRAKALMAAGYTQAEIAEALGVSLSVLKGALYD